MQKALCVCAHLPHAEVCSSLGRHGLNKHSYRHTGWKGMGVDNDIGNYAIRSEGHVILRVKDRHSALN